MSGWMEGQMDGWTDGTCVYRSIASLKRLARKAVFPPSCRSATLQRRANRMINPHQESFHITRALSPHQLGMTSHRSYLQLRCGMLNEVLRQHCQRVGCRHQVVRAKRVARSSAFW